MATANRVYKLQILSSDSQTAHQLSSNDVSRCVLSIIQRNPISCAMNISIIVAVTLMLVVVLYLEHFHAANVLRATWGPKTIEIFAHIHRMVTECECECECPLSTSRPTVRIVVLFEQWAVCDDPGVCCPRCSIVSRVGSQLQLQVQLELEFEIPLIMLRRSQVINLISHNALPGSIKGSIDDPSREQEVAKERGCPRVAIECLSLCSQPDV